MRKRWRSGRLALVLGAGVALAGLIVSPAIGGPGFLTKRKATRLFLKKSDAARIFLSKQEAGARFLTDGDAEGRFYSRAEADGRFLRPEGEVRFSSGPTEWTLGPSIIGPSPTIAYLADAATIKSAGEAVAAVEMTPGLPASLYGRPTKVAGVELCYGASAGAQLQLVAFETVTETAGAGGSAPPLTPVATDGTTRTDSAFRAYRAAQPVPLGPADYAVLELIVDFPTGSPATFFAGRASFLLVP